jgi:sugar diacid utilization regulator
MTDDIAADHGNAAAEPGALDSVTKPGSPDELRELRRTINGLQELMVLSTLLFDRHNVDDVLEVLRGSVTSMTGCTLVEMSMHLGDKWIRWPPDAPLSDSPAPKRRPVVEQDGASWRCTARVAGFSGQPGRLVLAASRKPDRAQRFVIERLGHMLGAALLDAELHERDDRRALELDQINSELTETVAALEQRAVVQAIFTELATGTEHGVATVLAQLTGNTAVVRDGFGHETARVVTKGGPVSPAQLVPPVVAGAMSQHDGTVVIGTSATGELGTVSLEPGHAHDAAARFALQYAATVLGLMRSHEHAIRETENRLSRELVQDLLVGAEPRASLARALAQGHDLRVAHDVVLVGWSSLDDAGHAARDSAESRIREAMDGQGLPFLVGRAPDTVVFVVHAGVDIVRLYGDLRRLMLPRSDGQVAIGEPAADIEQIPRAFAQARRALAARRLSRDAYGAAAYADLGVIRVLALEENAAEIERLISDWLGTLIRYDADRGTDLVATLAAYLDLGGTYGETAKALSIHRNTLRYRLARITEVSGHVLTDPETQLNLHLATRAWRFRRPAAANGRRKG